MGIVTLSFGIGIALLLIVLVKFLRSISTEFKDVSQVMRDCTEQLNAQNRLMQAELARVRKKLEELEIKLEK